MGHALAGALAGEVRFDNTTRAAYATDSSNYRQVPLGVVFPRDEDDVVAASRLAAEAGAALLGRGAGTSLAGQGCNEAVVLDMSRHMRRVVAIDPDRRQARAQPGVVLDDLRRAAESHGLTFGPDPATHAWCTLGGMIGNNSCGTHSIYAGNTVDNVSSLRVVLAGGERLEVGSYDEATVAAAKASGSRLGALLSSLADLGGRYRGLIEERYPDIPRRVSGYNLDQLVPGRDLHVARSLVGTESTCAFTTEATLDLVTSPPQRCLVAIGYRDVYAAAEAVPALLEHRLLALEGFDRTLIEQMKAHHLNQDGVALLPAGDGWLLAELGGESLEEAASLAADLVRSLPPDVAWRQETDRALQARLWAVRESGLGATAIRADGHHNLEGWEDGAVPPERLAEYLRGVAKLWQEHGYSGAWYGHFGQGCVHTRNNFDLSRPQGVRHYRDYVHAAAQLVVSLGGSLSGEHGDGQSRGELLTIMFGPELVGAFGEMKRIWDPDGLMNPGKVVDPYPLDTNLRFTNLSEPVTMRPTGYSFAADSGSLLNAALRCVGVGRCRREETATMCPSYRATMDEVHSTRGRAKVLAEMFQGDISPASWRNEEVREALDLCLSCKACASDCPTHVDMATYKSEFYSHYYKRRLRPAPMYAMGLLPWAARATVAAPVLARAANAALGGRRVGALIKRAAGISVQRPAPRFTSEGSFRARVGRDHRGVLDRSPANSSVVVFADTFTNSFQPGVGLDTVSCLEAMGETVAVPASWACCGRTLYDFGMLDLAKTTLRRLVRVLRPWTSAGVPVVVPEPSCLAAFRDELPALLPGLDEARDLARLARSPAEHFGAGDLTQRLQQARQHQRSVASPSDQGQTGGPPRKAVLHPHCHQRAVGGAQAEAAVLRALGYQVEVLDGGCCGLAGSFGFEAHHEAVSRKIGSELWLPKLEASLQGGAELVIDGFSCRTQLQHLAPSLAARNQPLPSLLRRYLGGPMA